MCVCGSTAQITDCVLWIAHKPLSAKPFIHRVTLGFFARWFVFLFSIISSFLAKISSFNKRIISVQTLGCISGTKLCAVLRRPSTVCSWCIVMCPLIVVREMGFQNCAAAQALRAKIYTNSKTKPNCQPVDETNRQPVTFFFFLCLKAKLLLANSSCGENAFSKGTSSKTA